MTPIHDRSRSKDLTLSLQNMSLMESRPVYAFLVNSSEQRAIWQKVATRAFELDSNIMYTSPQDLSSQASIDTGQVPVLEALIIWDKGAQRATAWRLALTGS